MSDKHLLFLIYISIIKKKPLGGWLLLLNHPAGIHSSIHPNILNIFS